MRYRHFLATATDFQLILCSCHFFTATPYTYSMHAILNSYLSSVLHKYLQVKFVLSFGLMTKILIELKNSFHSGTETFLLIYCWIWYLLVQCAAVSTCRSVMSTPPQYCSKPSGVMEAIHGHSRGFAGLEPTKRPWARVLRPQPVK